MGWLEEVIEARKRESFADAAAVLSRELAIRPHDPQLHYQLAWTHDALGKERDAVPAYEKAIELGLSGSDLQSAYLGLGSTYRTLGEYEKSAAVFAMGRAAFPADRALEVFQALNFFNLGKGEQAMEILIRQLAETSSDEDIQSYRKALLFYSDKLHQVFE